MADYSSEIATAKDLINEYGVAIDVIHYDDALPSDPLKPWELGPPTQTVESTRGVFLTSKHVKYGLAVDEQADTDSVPNQERRVLLAADGLVRIPTVKSELVSGGERWKIVSVIPLRPGGVNILYTLQVRR
jgi:hypothetical protein